MILIVIDLRFASHFERGRSESRGLSLVGGAATTKGPRRRRPRKHHRNRYAIIAEILAIAQQGERKSHIMYRANLSFDELTEYLGFLRELGLIDQHFDPEEHAVMFKTTPAGLDFIKRYEELRGMMMMTVDDLTKNKKNE